MDDVPAWLLPRVSTASHGRRELAEGPLFISYPVGLEPNELREGMPLQVRWEDAADRFGEYNLPVFGPPAVRG